MLEVCGLIKRFAAIQVLHGVSLQLRAGEVVGYLGPNGSGKSVTTRILTGLIEPSAGTVSYNGRNIHADLVEFRRHVGYVPERTGVGARRDLDPRAAPPDSVAG